MATAKTGTFHLTETVRMDAGQLNGTRNQGSIDLGAYVDVVSGQALSITSIDWVIQRDSDFGTEISAFVTSNGAISFQVCDLNPGTAFVRADDASLIGSGSLNIDFVNNIGTQMADLYPDRFGSDDAFHVVNDSLYVVVGNDGTNIGTGHLEVTVNLTCKIVKLSQRDFVAIAIQSTSSDN